MAKKSSKDLAPPAKQEQISRPISLVSSKCDFKIEAQAFSITGRTDVKGTQFRIAGGDFAIRIDSDKCDWMMAHESAEFKTSIQRNRSDWSIQGRSAAGFNANLVSSKRDWRVLAQAPEIDFNVESVADRFRAVTKTPSANLRMGSSKCDWILESQAEQVETLISGSPANTSIRGKFGQVAGELMSSKCDWKFELLDTLGQVRASSALKQIKINARIGGGGGGGASVSSNKCDWLLDAEMSRILLP